MGGVIQDTIFSDNFKKAPNYKVIAKNLFK